MRRIASALALALGAALAACGSGSEGAKPAAAPTPAAHDAEVKTASADAPPRRQGRPLPAFSGFTLDERRLDVSSLIGKRVLLIFFEPGAQDSEAAVSAAARIADLRAKNNFEIVGVAIGSNRDRAREFAAQLHLPFPILDDSGRRIAQQLGLR